MTQATEIPRPPTRASETRLIAGVCLAHLVSHYYMVLLAPLFVFIRADYGVSYTELGLALTAFNLVSAVLQTPVGFLVDRIGARLNLIGGLLLGSGAVAVAGLVDSFWVFVAMYAVLGLANTVYHPADYTLLPSTCRAEAHHPGVLVPHLRRHGRLGDRAGHASVHAEHGGLARRVSRARRVARRRRGADPRFAGQSRRFTAPRTRRSRASDGSRRARRRLAAAAVAADPAQSRVLRRAVDGRRRPQPVPGRRPARRCTGRRRSLANTALTGLLAMSAVGVLVGGALAARTARHNLVAAVGLLVTGAVSALIGFVDPGALLLVLVVSLSGFASGMTMPSRDMIVRVGHAARLVRQGVRLRDHRLPHRRHGGAVDLRPVARSRPSARGVPLHRGLRAGGHRHRHVRHVGPAPRVGRATRRPTRPFPAPRSAGRYARARRRVHLHKGKARFAPCDDSRAFRTMRLDRRGARSRSF